MKLLIVGDGLKSYSGWPTPAQRILSDALTEAGLRESDVTIVETAKALSACSSKKPHCVLALGDTAAKTLLPELTESVARVRGFIFDSDCAPKVICTADPETAAAQWVPWRMLLTYDLQRAKKEALNAAIERPTREVYVVRSLGDARRVEKIIRDSRRVAADIEIYNSSELQCVGFATDSRHAYVFPGGLARSAFGILRDHPELIWQNGQFDAHFLLTRYDVDIRIGDDTLVAWHSCYPELAGASQDEIGRKRGAKRTHKSLHFLSSLFTRDSWWKNYDTDDAGMYTLCGIDCCTTFEIMEALDAEIDRLGVRRIYAHTLRLLKPCVAMQARGLPIDDGLRQERVDALQARLDSASETMNVLVLPLLQQHIDALRPEVQSLFRWRKVCPCCRNGAGKRDACWSCAGFEKAPGKRQLAASGRELRRCQACNGEGVFEGLEFNPRSNDQKKAILYDILKLPTRYVEGKISVDSDSLKSLLPLVA